MSKPITPVDKEKLSLSIREAENKDTFPTRSQLWLAVTDIYNRKNPPQTITTSVVMLRATEWNLPVKTPKGKRGRQAGTPLSAEQKAAMRNGRKGRGEKFKDEKSQQVIKKLRESTPERFHHLVDLAANGSRAAADKLKCLDCSCYQTQEIKHCEVYGCSLWLYRPYQNGGKIEAEELVEETDELESLDGMED